MLELEVLMPPKNTTSKMQRRAGELRQNQTEAEKQGYGHVCAHIGWQEFNFEGGTQLEITWWIFAHHAEN